MCGDFSEAQDCVQEAFIRAAMHRTSLEMARAPEAVRAHVAWRLAISRWRRTKRALALIDRWRHPAPPAEPDIVHTALVAALRQIPEAQRRAIVLYHICDLSVAQIAAESGMAIGTVKARLQPGRTALAHLLTIDHTGEARHV